MLRKWKDKWWTGRKYLQSTYLIKDNESKSMKNSLSSCGRLNDVSQSYLGLNSWNLWMSSYMTKRNFADVIKLRILRWRDYPGLFGWALNIIGASLVTQMVKNLPAMQDTQVQSLSWADPLEKRMATNSSILAWRTPWTEDPGGLYSSWGRRVRHNWVTNTLLLPSDTNKMMCSEWSKDLIIGWFT